MKGKMKTFVLIGAVVLAMIAVISTPTAKATADYPVVCEPGDVVCETLDGIGSEYIETPTTTEDLLVNQAGCYRRRTIHAGYQYKAFTGYPTWWKFQVQVQWCYNGLKVQKIIRQFKIATTDPWGYDGWVGGSCATSQCNELSGLYGAQVITEGKFSACVTVPLIGTSICANRYPWVELDINAVGNWSKHVWGP